MKESSTYREILEEGRSEGIAKGIAKGLAKGLAKGRKEGRKSGRVEEGRAILLRQGRIRFGEPGKTVQRRIATLDEPARLEQLAERILVVGSWDELLADPAAGNV